MSSAASVPTRRSARLSHRETRSAEQASRGRDTLNKAFATQDNARALNVVQGLGANFGTAMRASHRSGVTDNTGYDFLGFRCCSSD